MHETVQPRTLTRPDPGETGGFAIASGSRLRVALAHDWLCGLRGGEHVLDAVARMLAPSCEIAGLFVMFDDRRSLTPAIDQLPKFVSSIGRLPGASGRLRRWMLPLYPAAVEDLSDQLAREHARRRIDLVISTSSAAIKGLRPPERVPHVCYIHSPARYVWSLGSEYERGSMLRRAGLRLYRERFKEWDRATAEHVTRFVANSTHTGAEVRRCYGRTADVVFPPVRTEFFTPPPPGSERTGWLVVSALEPYKRVDLAIAAANREQADLTIVGDGSQRRALARLAGPTVRFAGRVNDADLRQAYRGAQVLLFPQVEDFGIAAVEAQACGCPVVAFGKGGALDTVVNGVTGWLCEQQSAEALIGGAMNCPKQCDQACRDNAERFAESVFVTGLESQIRLALREV